MDLREMGDEHVVNIDENAKSAWPPWKHLLEDLADAQPPPSSIKLAYKNLGDAGACRLAELLKGALRSITVLDLSCTSIGSSGATAIASAVGTHESLRALDMSSNAVTDGGALAFAECLKTNTTLQSLCLHACLIGDKGATALADALQTNSTLLELNLRQNYIDDDGAARLASLIQSSQTLRVLDVQSNSYKRNGKAALAQAWAANPRVDRSMPLAVSYGGEEGAEGVLARLAQPPRSLVSVDSAGSNSKNLMMGRKKQGALSPTHLQTNTRQSGSLNSSPISPKDKGGVTAKGGAGRAGTGQIAVFITKGEEDDNAKPLRREKSGLGSVGGGGLAGLAKRVLMAVSGGKLRSMAAVRYALFGAIILAAMGLLIVSHNRLEAAEESMKNAPQKGGLLFASRQREVRKQLSGATPSPAAPAGGAAGGAAVMTTPAAKLRR